MRRGVQRRTAASVVTVGTALALAVLSPVPAAGAAKAGADLPANFFGVATFEVPTPSEFSRMTAAGIGVSRAVFFQGAIEPVPGARDWTYYDALVSRAAQGGVTLTPVLFGVPAWMSSKPARMPIDSPAQESSWTSFVADVASRYGPGGGFWSQHPELVPRPMIHWETWNEPNINEYVGAPASAVRYGRLLQITDAALRAGNPSTRTMVAGLYRRPRPGLGVPANVFLNRLYHVKGSEKWFDAVGLHPYGSSVRQAVKVVRRTRQVMDDNGDRRGTIWVTELGWSTGGENWARSLYRATPKQQATRLTRTYRTLIRERAQLRLRQITWHVWRDYAGPPHPLGWIFQMGLFTNDGHPKPAWEALRKITRGSGTGAIGGLEEPPPPGIPPPGPGPPAPAQPSPEPSPEPCVFPGLFC